MTERGRVISKRTIFFAASYFLAASTVRAAIVLDAVNTPVMIGFNSSMAGVVTVATGHIRGVMESGWWAINGPDQGLHAATFVIRNDNLIEYGFGNGVPGYFIDGNNDGDVEDQFGGSGVAWHPYGTTPNNVSHMVRLSGSDDWAGNDIFIRIQNHTGQTVPKWRIAFNLYGVEDSDDGRSTVYFEHVVSDSLQPGVLTYNTLGSQLIPNNGSTSELALVGNISLTFDAPVAHGGHLIFRLRETMPQWTPGSGVFFDDLEVEAIPEPGSLGMMVGVGGLWLLRRRTRCS